LNASDFKVMMYSEILDFHNVDAAAAAAAAAEQQAREM
jgi:hypothetical protein